MQGDLEAGRKPQFGLVPSFNNTWDATLKGRVLHKSAGSASRANGGVIGCVNGLNGRRERSKLMLL